MLSRRNPIRPGINSKDSELPEPTSDPSSATRRSFLGRLGGAAAATLAAGTVELALPRTAAAHEGSRDRDRENDSFQIRVRAASEEREVHIPTNETNGDEERYSNFIGSFSKGLPHNALGEVDSNAYHLYLDAVRKSSAAAFENVPLGGTVKLVNPMSGVCFDLEGTDSHQMAIPAPPRLASEARADDMIELYWMALTRDVNFADYETDATAQAAAAEISSLTEFVGPRLGAKVNAQSLFRGFTADDLVGPFVSQLLLRAFNYGQYALTGQMVTHIPGADFMATPAEWLQARNGQGPFPAVQFDPQQRFIRNGRDLGAYVHTDQVFQAFYNAGIWLFGHGAPLNSGNPYLKLTKQSGFTTFGAPQFLILLAEVASRALKAVFCAKWFVHRTLRPEDYGGLVHMTKQNQASYPVHSTVLNSRALEQSFAKFGSYLLAQEYPEGCPQHPSYAQGHGAIAGAAATILKAAVNGSAPFTSLQKGAIQVSSDDGLSLVPYPGSDTGQITINGEINKLASNIGIARNFAGVHWRTDYSEGLKLGERVALSVLSDQKETFQEDFSGFVITKFDGSTVTV
jgi:membrane-associated phospholipid phosphatase